MAPDRQIRSFQRIHSPREVEKMVFPALEDPARAEKARRAVLAAAVLELCRRGAVRYDRCRALLRRVRRAP